MKFAKTAWFMLPLDYATSRGRLRIFQNDEFIVVKCVSLAVHPFACLKRRWTLANAEK